LKKKEGKKFSAKPSVYAAYNTSVSPEASQGTLVDLIFYGSKQPEGKIKIILT